MAHPRSCEQARRHKCLCSNCGGVLHGWPYSLALARSSEVERQRERDRVTAEWVTARPAKGRRTSTRRSRAAATDSARVDLVYWLSKNPSTVKNVQELGDILTGPVVGELDKAFRVKEPDFRKKLTNHFWCDLLIAFADGMKKCFGVLDRVPDYVADVIMSTRESEERSTIRDAIVRLAVRTAWAPVRVMLHTAGLEELQRTCRILAVLICPAPEDHAAVRNGALLPLVKEGLLEVSRERLEQVFPVDWVRRLREGLEGA